MTTSWDASSRSIDTTDGFSSTFYLSLSDQRSAILEEKQEDFVSYTPLDRGIFIVLYKSVIKNAWFLNRYYSLIGNQWVAILLSLYSVSSDYSVAIIV